MLQKMNAGMLRKMSRALKYSSGVLVLGGTYTVLAAHDWDVRAIGVVRFGRAALSVGAVVADYKWSLRGLDGGSEEYRKIMSETHLRSALRLRKLCCVNGGCFIKVGQHLGALDYLLPKEYVDTMKVLHSDAPQSDVSELHRVIREDLGHEVDEIFDDFQPTPLGAASLAQVHKAKLKDGTPVAVKIQHPYVKSHAFVDMACMELLIRGVAWMFPEFQFMWLAEETKKNLPKELDFIHEGKNCERIDKLMSHFKFLKVPKIYWDYSTERVLTMEYCEGCKVNDKGHMKKNNIDVNEVVTKLGEMYSEMIFVHGYIHCDPHPGNILVDQTDDGIELVLLDHGLYQTLTDDFRLNYCKLWKSLIDAKVNKIKKYSERLGTGKLYPLFACMVTARSWDSVSKGIDKRSVSVEEDLEIRSNAAAYLPQISEILNSVPRQMLLIFKTNDLLRGIESCLDSRSSSGSLIIMSKACIRAVSAHRMKHCPTRMGRVQIYFREKYSIFRLYMYSLWLWIDSMFRRRRKQVIKDFAANIIS